MIRHTCHRIAVGLRRLSPVVFLSVLVSTNTACADVPQPAEPVIYTYEVVNTYPHDRGAFTQGLVYRDGFLYESTGLQGQSSLRKVVLETGAVVQQRSVDAQHFAEGLVDWKDRLIQLTWQSKQGFVYDLATFEPKRVFGYPGEGWGLAHDGERLIMSDGTATLRFLDPDSLQETGRIDASFKGQSLPRLNELEMVKDRLYANIWPSNFIAMIDPKTGHAVGIADLTGLLKPEDAGGRVDVLNGIAYDAAGDRLFVTGKLWPKLFEIRLVRKKPDTSR